MTSSPESRPALVRILAVTALCLFVGISILALDRAPAATAVAAPEATEIVVAIPSIPPIADLPELTKDLEVLRENVETLRLHASRHVESAPTRIKVRRQ